MDLNILKQKNKNGTHEEIDYLFNTIDEMIEQVKFREIDEEIFNFIEDGNFDFNVYVSFLTVTNRAKHKFKNRKLLWEKALEKGKEYLTDKQVKFTLNKLE